MGTSAGAFILFLNYLGSITKVSINEDSKYSSN